MYRYVINGFDIDGNETTILVKDEDGVRTWIPLDEDNIDYQDFLNNSVDQNIETVNIADLF